jgi:hypothetical protein
MSRFLRVVIAVYFLLLAVFVAYADALNSYGRMSCIPATTGTPATSVTVERSVVNSGTWATVAGPFTLPAAPTLFTDTTRVSGTSYQYRCLFTAAGGSTPSDPTVAATFIDNVGVPGKGTIDFIIITQ